LYVILSQYRYNPMLTNMNLRDSSGRELTVDYSGLKYRTLRFTPKAAQRADSPDPPTMENSTDRFVAVDYQLLQQAWRNLEAKKQAAPQVGGEALEAARAAEAQARAAEAQARIAEAQARNTAETQARATEAQARNTEALAQEVDTLKKQLESIQKQLGNQTTGQDSPKQKTAPPAKPQ
jgi:chromosome condensin MukBEF ATPase and DNA-binding subunit MukB